jgi:hypothetical protein
MPLPDNINIDCMYQTQRETLICNLALSRAHTTQEVNPETCLECPIGKIYRELGCEYISGKLRIISLLNGSQKITPPKLWCKLRKRETDYNFCLTCPYIGTQFTKPIIKETTDFFKVLGFENSKKYLEKAQEKLHEGDRESAITNSISALESTFKSVLDLLKKKYPAKEGITSLWKSVKECLQLKNEIASPNLMQLIGSLSGAMSALGNLRNTLSDAHGKGLLSPAIYDSYAELALNLSASVSLFVMRRYKELNLKNG